MKAIAVLLILTICFLLKSNAAPVEAKTVTNDVKSAFGPAFDEIVVESSFTVRRKTDPGRQARNKDVAEKVSANLGNERRQKREAQRHKNRPNHNHHRQSHRQSHPEQNHPEQNHPEQNHPEQNHPEHNGQNHNRQNLPVNNFPGNNFPGNNFGNNFPANNFPNKNFPAFPSGGSAQAGAQAQDFNSNGPLGSFGASAAGTQTQALNFGPGGPAGSAAFGMTQQYRLPNGQVLDFTINNSFGGTNGAFAKGGGSSLTIRNPNAPGAAR